VRGRLGIGIDGTKHPLALVEGSTENTTLVRSLLVGLRDRGLDVTRPILAVLLGLIAAAVEEAEQARIAVLLLPGVGTVEDLRKAHETGGDGGPDRDTLHRSRRLGPALRRGAGTRLRDRRVLDAGPSAGSGEPGPAGADHGRRGAQCVYVVDSAGALVLGDAQARISALVAEIGTEAQVGFHGHQNLSLSVANSVLAQQNGALQIDGALCALGAGAGNAPPRCCAPPSSDSGWPPASTYPACCVPPMSRPADDPATAIHRPLGDRAGNRGVYSSFLLHAERAAERYEIPAHAILQRVGEAGYVGGQEDMIIDVALQLQREQDDVATGHYD
jgi:4-hydroxy 2-oxovalerate aldolase